MTTTEAIDLTCPNCSTEFNSEALASTNNFGGIKTDFREMAAGHQPRQFLIHACSGCGFAGFIKDFDRGPLPTGLARLIKEQLTPSTRDKRTPAWRKFEAAAQISIWRNRSAEETAGLFLMAAYSCADDGASQEEIHNRTRAIDFFGKALDDGVVATEEIPQTTYLVGELCRRVGRQTDAAKWLDRAEVLSATHPELDWLLKLAKQQRVDPQEYIQGYCRPLPLLKRFRNMIVLR